MNRNQKPAWLNLVCLNLVCLNIGLAVGLVPVSCAADDVTGRRQVALVQDTLPNTEAAAAKDSALSAEQKALDFIEEHQPKLRKLMEILKSKQPASYQQALKELGRSQQRLESLGKRDPELYEIELDLWLVRSRLRLLAAEMSVAKVTDQTDRTDELTKLIEQEAKRDLQRMQLLRERAAQQVIKLDEEIAKRNAAHDELIAKALKGWQNKIKKQSSSKK